MGRPLFTNNAATYLAFGITNTATTMQVSANAGSLFPNPTGGDYFYVSLISLSGPIIEIVKCTARSGDVFTIVRGQEGTTPLYWNMGDNVQLRITAGSLNLFSNDTDAGNINFTPYSFITSTNVQGAIDQTADKINSFSASTGSSEIGYNEGCPGAVNQTVQNKLQQFLDVQDFDSFTDALSCANSGSVKTLVLSSTVVGDGITIPSGVNLVIKEGGLITISAATTFTINGKLTAGNYKIFSIPINTLGIAFTGSVVFGTGSVEFVTPTWYGASNNATFPYDTAAVQAAFDTGLTVNFTANYSVDNVSLNNNGQTIDFKGFFLAGASNYGSEYLLRIMGAYNKLYNIELGTGFNFYVGAFFWQSDATHVCQFNKVFGLNIYDSVYGVVYGQVPYGAPAYNAAQSENTIYSYTTRAVQIPLCCNQPNGALTMVSPILDCDPFEWTSQPGYNAVTYGTNAYCVINLQTGLTVIGGELVKATSQYGYGIWGGGTFQNNTIEIACTQALITHDLTISDCEDGYYSNDHLPAFTFDYHASGVAQGATLILNNYELIRPNAIQLYSGSQFITGTPLLPCSVVMQNSTVQNWYAGNLLDPAATNITLNVKGTQFVSYLGSGALDVYQKLPDTESKQTSTIASAATIYPMGQICTVSGTAAISTIGLPYTGFTGQITLIPTGAFTTTTSGNIANASTAIIGQALTMTYDGSKWHPSY